MDENNKDLLREVVENRLTKALNGTDEEKEIAFKDAMQAVDRLDARQKAYDAYEDQTAKVNLEQQKIDLEKEKIAREDEKMSLEREKLEFEKTRLEQETVTKTKDRKINIILKSVEIGVPILLLGVKFILDRANMKLIGNFEKDYTWTTTPGKVLSKRLFDK